MRLNRRIIEDFLSLQSKLPAVVDGFGLKHKHIYEGAGIPKASYFRKLKTASFTGEELLKIADVINR